MKKSKLQKTITDTLSSIDGAMAALDSYPNLEDAILSRAQREADKYLGKIFPTQLDFSKDVLEHLVGTDKMIDIVSEFLTVALPEVEISLKAALLANMNNLGTGCTIDPFIYEKVIKEGIIFDLKQIDLIDKLTISPLDKKLGQYYYFGIEDCESSYDVLQSAIGPDTQEIDYSAQKTSYLSRSIDNSVGHYFGKRKRDFDCLLWYMKNKAVYREVWGKTTAKSEDIFNGRGNEKIEQWLVEKGNKSSAYYTVENGKVHIYTYVSDNNWIENSGGYVIPVDTNTEYTYKIGNSCYKYSYGKPSIKKISRGKYYFDGNDNSLWSYSNNIWVSSNVDISKKYSSIDTLPTDGTIKKNSIIVIGNDVCIVTSEPKINTKKKNDKNGKVYEAKYLTKLSYSKAIDVTNDIKQKISMFVDYDLNDNGDKIKNGRIKDVNVAFGTTYDNVQKTWNREKVSNDKNSDGTIMENLYYDGNSEYNPITDNILIPPRVWVDGTIVKCINVSDKISSDTKYTKDFGIVTLEFSPRTGNVIQSDGKPMKQQTPYDNVLHVFFGNVKELPDSKRDNIELDLKNSSETNKKCASVLNKLETIEKTHIKLWKKREEEHKKIPETIRNSNESIQEYRKEYDDYNNAYLIYRLFRLGNGNNVKNRLIADNYCFNDIDKLNEALNSINDIIDRYYKAYTIESVDKDGNKKTKTTSDYIPISGEFSYDIVKEFAEELLECLKGYEKDYDAVGKITSISAYQARASQIFEANENLLYLSAKDKKYPKPYKDYYLNRTLFEFNTDYINSLQLFDTKVLAAQVITSLFGGLTISAILGATASWKTELIRDTVNDMVEKAIASQDYSVSDCFFTFTNDAYNGMLKAAELRQAGLYSKHGEENGNNTIDPVELLNGLNDLSDSADQSEQISLIKGAILNVAEQVSKDIYKEKTSMVVNENFSVQMSFVESLIKNLCTQIVMSILSPKVYLLILINLQLFGMTTNFDLKSFMQNFSNLIMSMVKSVVNQFMQYLNTKIMEIVEDLVSKLMSKLSFEQAEMYARLLKQILQHFRSMRTCGDGSGWTQDVVGSADIIETDIKELVDEC